MTNVITFPDAIGKVTEKAFQAFYDGSWVWLPKSQVDASKRFVDGVEHYRVIMPKWLADKHGLTAKNFDGSSKHFHMYE